MGRAGFRRFRERVEAMCYGVAGEWRSTGASAAFGDGVSQKRPYNRSRLSFRKILLRHSERFQRRLVDRAGGLEAKGALIGGQGLLGLRADQAVHFSLI